jgi:hypothetical protein
MNVRHRVLLVAALIAVPLAAEAGPTTFRITDLDWRDPHFYVNFIGCRDITDTQLAGFSINSAMQTNIQTDGDMDGKLDESYLIVFDPLDQAGAGGTLVFSGGSCTAPMAGTTCNSTGFTQTYGSYSNMLATCLSTLAGTTKPYAPAVTVPSAPCFVVSLGTVTLNVAGIPITLQDTYLAATYVGFPASGLSNGLIRGFISEADANATIIPQSMALFGGQPLSSLWPGGNNCCATFSDKDVNNGTVGWYCYLNFVASRVNYTGPTPVRDTLPAALAIETPAPNPFNPTTTLRYMLPASGSVRLTVYDANGRVITRLVDENESKGAHSVTWNGRDARGASVSSGVYFAQLESAGELRTTKMVLLK